MNFGEYGYVIRISVGEDISSATNSLIFRSPEPHVVEKVRDSSDGLVVGNTTQVIDGVTYTANQYIEYTVQDGDIEFPGNDWRVRVSAEFSPTLRKLTDWLTISIED